MKTSNDLSRRKFLTLTAQGMIVSALLPSALQAATANGTVSQTSTKNVNRIFSDPNAYIRQMKLFTDTYKKYSKGSTAVREIECLKVQLPMYFCDIQEGDLFVGRERKPMIGFMAQGASSFGYYIDEGQLNNLLADTSLSAENKKILSDLAAYWKEENSNQQCRNAFPPGMKKVLNSEGWQTEPAIASPLYRLSGTQCDFDKLIRLGISGMKAEVLKFRNKVAQNSESYPIYVGMEQALDLFSKVANDYADKAKLQSASAVGGRKKELLDMEKVLRKIAVNKPETFREGLQVMFLYANISGTINYGRMDEYMGDLYVKEIN